MKSEQESDFAQFRKGEIKKRNSLNRARSKSQERAVAKFLGAHRVPMSGAGSLKGDGIWNSPMGLVVYECKYSAAINPLYGPSLRLTVEWFPKLDKDVASMKAKFGFLVLHYYKQVGGAPWGTCFVKREDAEWLLEPQWLEGSYEYDLGQYRGYMLYYKEIRMHYKMNRLFPCATMTTSYGPYVLLPLWALKQRIVDVASGDASDFVGVDPA